HGPHPARIYPLSLHDALPISRRARAGGAVNAQAARATARARARATARARARATVAALPRSLEATAVGRAAMMARRATPPPRRRRSEEHTSELQSRGHLVCRLL